MESSRQIASAFLSHILEKEHKKDILLLNFTSPQILNISFDSIVELKNKDELIKIEQRQFDIIIGDLPFGMRPIVLDNISKIKGNENWKYLLMSLRILKDTGKAFFLVEPSILFSHQGKQFINYLFEQGYFLNSLFELPENLLYPETMFQPIIVHFEKQKQGQFFVAEIASEYERLLNSFYTRTNSNSLFSGILVDRDNFESFQKFKIEKEIKNIKTQYKEYEKYSLSDVANEINLTRDTFQDKQNSIYIPLIGNSIVTSDIKLTTVKHHNLFQVVLNPDLVKAEFLAMFFRSDLGKKQLQRSAKENSLPKINKKGILDCIVSIPDIKEQDLLILTNTKLSELQETIDKLKEELSLNPKNAIVILDKLEDVQSTFKKISEEDQIKKLIRQGEGKKIEFKENYSKEINTSEKDNEIKKSWLKTIVGFLNTDGGTLLIGVADNGEIKGIEDDSFKKPDKYKLNIKNAIRDKIGLEFISFIDYDLFKVNGKLILKVECKKGNEPCFLEGKEFYVRTNPSTEKLEGKKQLDYIKERFK